MLPDGFASLEKAELHLHIEGTLEPQMVQVLAARNEVDLPVGDAGVPTRAHEFEDLASFLWLYYNCMSVLRTAQDFYDLADAYLQKARGDGVVHAEIFFDPQAHTGRGVPVGEVIGGLSAALRGSPAKYGISAGLIACFLRDRGPTEAMRALEAMAPHASSLLAVGLDSCEVGYPPELFAPVFEAATQLGLRRVAHAGEEGPPEYVWQAIDVLGAERVDHGIRSMEDRALVRRLAADRLPLTVCPLSNVKLRCVTSMAEHPLPAMLDAGLLVTINSDDPAFFGGYIGDNYRAVAGGCQLSPAVMSELAGNSLRASFHSCA